MSTSAKFAARSPKWILPTCPKVLPFKSHCPNLPWLSCAKPLNQFSQLPIRRWKRRRNELGKLMDARRLRLRLGCLLALCALVALHLATADDSKWMSRVWQLDEGLPGSSVTGVAQTPDGYLWVSTEGGLARFDGVRFQNLPVPIPSGRKRPIIRAMLLEPKGGIWLALEGGLVISLDGPATRIFTKADGLTGIRCENLALDGKNCLWTSHSDGTVCRIAEGVVTRFAESNGPPGKGPCFLTADNKGQIWFARADNIGIIRDAHFQIVLKQSGGNIRLGRCADGGIWACAGLELLHCEESGAVSKCGVLPVKRPGVESTVILEDSAKAIWIGTSVDGLFRHAGSNFERVATSNEMVLSLNEDRDGSIWAGTGGGGLDRLRPALVELQTSESGLPTTTVRSICEDTSGALWAVGENGRLARQVEGKWTSLTGADGWPDARATAVVSDRQGGVWVGTSDRGLLHSSLGSVSAVERKSGLASNVVRGLLVDHTGDLWIALEFPSCLQRLHNNEFKTFTLGTKGAPRTLAEDTAGTLWCGTQDGFLFHLDGDGVKNETAHAVDPQKPIRCLLARPDGSLWIGYAGAGLGIWRDGKFQQISEEQGLYDDYICSMAADDAGGFWCATDHGLVRAPVSEIEAVAAGRLGKIHSIHLGRDEGLQNLQGAFGYTPSMEKSRDGSLWFPMRSGLAVVHPLRFSTMQTPPSVLIEQITVDGRPAATGADGRWILPAGHQRLDFAFTAPALLAADDLVFRYQLGRWDQGWNESGAQRSATYSRLPAGNYTFTVAAGNRAGAWSPRETSASLTVLPFLWERWPVRVAALALFTLGVVLAARYISARRWARKVARLEEESALQRERSRIAQDLHDDIGASLTHIAMLSELAQKDFEQPEAAKGHIDQIFRSAQTVARSLDEIVWTVNPSNDTLDVFISHLCTYAPDFLRSANVRCRLDVPLDIPVIPLPSRVAHHLYLAVKEALHNIVKHAGAKEVWLRLQLNSDPTVVTITIEDDGRGFVCDTSRPADADGLDNLQKRLESIGGRCEQHSEPGRGATTTFVAPLPSSDN